MSLGFPANADTMGCTCIATEDGQWLEISDLGSRGIALSM